MRGGDTAFPQNPPALFHQDTAVGPRVSITGTQAFKYLTYLFKERGVDSQLCAVGVWEVTSVP